MLLSLVLFGRLKAKERAWFSIPNRTLLLWCQSLPGSSHFHVVEALLKSISHDEARQCGAHKASPHVSGHNSARSRGQG